MTTEAGSLKLILTSSSSSYTPGQCVTALVMLACPSEHYNPELKELDIKFTGIERTDASWIAPSYRSSLPPINTDKRRVQRHLVNARLQAAAQGDFSFSSSIRKFIIRFQLPLWLPPTYKGTAARFHYSLSVTVSHFNSTKHDNPSTTTTTTIETTSIKIPIKLNPLLLLTKHHSNIDSKQQTDILEEALLHSNPDTCMSVKCWEVGTGTSVHDAVDHIAKIALEHASMNCMSPSSPGRRPTIDFNSTNGIGAMMGGVALSSSSSLLRMHKSTTAAAVGSQVELNQSLAAADDDNDEDRKNMNTATRIEAHTGHGSRSYGLRLGSSPVVRVNLAPPLEGVLCAGSTVAGTLDFSESYAGTTCDVNDSQKKGTKCIQVQISLESEETVQPKWQKKKNASSSAAGMVFRNVQDELFEVTIDTELTSFVFSLPQDSLPGFSCSLISFRWLLRFTFTVMVGSRVEELEWVLPLEIS